MYHHLPGPQYPHSETLPRSPKLQLLLYLIKATGVCKKAHGPGKAHVDNTQSPDPSLTSRPLLLRATSCCSPSVFSFISSSPWNYVNFLFSDFQC